MPVTVYTPPKVEFIFPNGNHAKSGNAQDNSVLLSPTKRRGRVAGTSVKGENALTYVRLPKKLMERAKAHCAANFQTFTDVVIALVLEWVRKEDKRVRSENVRPS